jgi:predicted DNA-binding transcriptional regulator YafY
MRRLQAAFVDERPIRAEYVKEGGESSVRRLDPHALVINWPAWYLVAYDHSRRDARTFRLDRFATVDIESGTFAPRASQIVRDVLQSAGVELDRV